MSFAPNLSDSVVNLVIGPSLPLLLRSAGGAPKAARALVLKLLADHCPQTAGELRLAGEVIGYSLKGMTMLAKSAEPGLTAAETENALMWATRLKRMSDQTLRRLDELQRARAKAHAAHAPVTPPQSAFPKTASPESRPPEPAALSAPAAETVLETDLAQAEATFTSAVKLLNLMKAHHKGARRRTQRRRRIFRRSSASWKPLE
ncbi:MAG: hypothetical protein ACJ8AW_38270 [Rhodopila sp.]